MAQKVLQKQLCQLQSFTDKNCSDPSIPGVQYYVCNTSTIFEKPELTNEWMNDFIAWRPYKTKD